MIDWSKYAIGGAASRPDSFTGLNPDYAARVAAMVQAADQELGPQALRITSAYRSPELQATLYQNALAKYGSEQAARKWVAPPGKSKHNSGMAVDFANAQGSLLRDPNSREAQWIKANAGRFGLDVPMSWEPWQVELSGSRGGAAPAQGAPQGQNALAVGQQPEAPPQAPERPELQLQDPRLDPRQFMTQTNALAPAPLQRATRNSLARI